MPHLRRRLPAVLLLALLPGTLLGCGEGKPLRIGFLGSLTGRTGDLGKAARDGLQLLIEQTNAQGGISGRKLELVVQDDAQNPETAREGLRLLAGQDVTVVVGPVTSAMSVAITPLAAELGMTLVSPTTGTTDLSGKDDAFLRVYPALSSLATQQAGYVRNQMGLSRIAIAIDAANRAFSGTYASHFSQRFTEIGGQTAVPLEFNSSASPPYADIAKDLAGQGGDGVLIVAGAVDTGLLAQALRRNGDARPLIASEWSSTGDLVKAGGSAIDGIHIMQTIHTEHPAPRYQTFRKAYQERFRADPGFAAILAYEAGEIIVDALRRKADRQSIKAKILEKTSYDGLQGRIELDRFGDVQRQGHPATIVNGQFILQR
jgi:branched-chain amino acid transport system substrate-binding protein